MWQIQLRISYLFLVFSTLFYIVIALYSTFLCWQYFSIVLSFPILIILFIEYRRVYRYLLSITGDFAIQPELRQLYWLQQRWIIIKKPLFLRYWVVIQIKSQRSGKQCRLWLSCYHFSRSHWRTCCYYLHRISDSL